MDDVTNPKTAFAWAKPSEYFLAGYPYNYEFNSSLQKLITEEINPETVKKNIKHSVLYRDSDSWGKINFMLKNHDYRKSYRWLFTFKELKVNWKRRLPLGFRMERLNEELLKRTDLKNFNIVADYIVFKWDSINAFCEKGFGFCMLRGDAIVSWCISSNNVGGKCEITIGTDKKHQNMGFATLTASAFIEYCISKNLTPSWHCGCNNLPSIAVAEKVGFKKTLMYPVYCWTPTTRKGLFWLMKNKLKKLITTSSFPL